MLDLSNFLSEIRTKGGIWNRLATMFENMQDAINQTANLAGVDSTEHTDPPDPPQAVAVSSGSDHIHVAITDNSVRSRALNYFVEWSPNDPSFLSPQVEHLGASRQLVLALPANDEEETPINYFVRVYSHSLGARAASAKLTFGGAANPTPITLTGSSTLKLLPSTGSGTASSIGQQGGEGFGTAQFSEIPPNKPKQP
jgi:hypothetical protein